MAEEIAARTALWGGLRDGTNGYGVRRLRLVEAVTSGVAFLAAGLVRVGAALSIGLAVYGVDRRDLDRRALRRGGRAGPPDALRPPRQEGALAALAGAEPDGRRPYPERLGRAVREAFRGVMDPGGDPGREPLGRLHPPKAVIVASAYALAVGELIHRTLSWRGLHEAFADAAARRR